jgi:hypothetical protein
LIVELLLISPAKSEPLDPSQVVDLKIRKNISLVHEQRGTALYSKTVWSSTVLKQQNAIVYLPICLKSGFESHLWEGTSELAADFLQKKEKWNYSNVLN